MIFFSLRTLSRAISTAIDDAANSRNSPEYCLKEGFKLAFSSQLGTEQYQQMVRLIDKHFKLLHQNNISSKNIHFDESKFV